MRPGWTRFLAGLTGLAWLGAAVAGEQRTEPVRPERQYDARVKLHPAPTDLPTPDEPRLPPSPLLPDVAAPPAPQPVLAPESPAVVPPAEGALERKPKKTSWILPPALEDLGFGEVAEPSGWGWLADDALKFRRRHERDEAEKAEEAERLREDMTEQRGTSAEVTLPGHSREPLLAPAWPAASRPGAREQKDRSQGEPAARPGERAAAPSGWQPLAGEARREEPAAGVSPLAEKQASERTEADRLGSATEPARSTFAPGLGQQFALPNTAALLEQIRPSWPKAELPALRDALAGYREGLVKPPDAGLPGLPKFGPAASPPRPSLEPSSVPKETRVEAWPVRATSEARTTAAGSWGPFSPGVAAAGAAPAVSATRALEPFQPAAPFGPLPEHGWGAGPSEPTRQPAGGMGGLRPGPGSSFFSLPAAGETR